MFESTTPFEDTAAQAGRGGETLQLRAFAWPELTARLAAARDVRAVLSRSGKPANAHKGGSFLTASVAQTGGTGERHSMNERPINLVGLSGSKSTAAMCADAVSDAAHVDREAP